MATTTTMSGAEFDQLPYEEGRHLELLHGEVIAMPSATPRHQLIVNALIVSLGGYLRSEPRGVTLPDSEFALGEDDRLRPDVAILLLRWAAVNPDKTTIPLAPDIAVEVLSPSERVNDSLRKIWKYLASGVQEVWQVSAETKRVLIYSPPKSITVRISARCSAPPCYRAGRSPCARSSALDDTYPSLS